MTATITEEIVENRKKFTEALLSDEGLQCRANLFEDHQGSKSARCALGLALEVFFGIKSFAELDRKMDEDPLFDPYGAVAGKLGLTESTPEHFTATRLITSTVGDIWRMNDILGYSFAKIGAALVQDWNL